MSPWKRRRKAKKAKKAKKAEAQEPIQVDVNHMTDLGLNPMAFGLPLHCVEDGCEAVCVVPAYALREIQHKAGALGWFALVDWAKRQPGFDWHFTGAGMLIDGQDIPIVGVVCPDCIDKVLATMGMNKAQIVSALAKAKADKESS